MKVLTLNAGSSSLKYKLYALPALELLATGQASRIGEPDGILDCRWRGADGRFRSARHEGAIVGHADALARVFADLATEGVLRDRRELCGVGHRVVHGGERFRAPVVIDEAVLAAIRELVPLAPLHNPANLKGIEVARRLCPGVPQVAVFDTAFHHTLPPHAFRYALPENLYREHRVRRYGFHGISVQYVSRRCAELMERPVEALNLMVAHLGNGASLTAVQGGRSVDTSMGMTPLEGLVMGTRSGDLDPALPFHLLRHADLGADELEALLFHGSGLKGLCGKGDMREVHALAAQGDESARLAEELFSYRLRKYIGAYTAVLGRVDGLVFTAGIGENDAALRGQVCAGLEGLGIVLDPERNAAPSSQARRISGAAGAVQVWVIPTDEELEIARCTVACTEPALTQKERSHE